MTSPADVDAVRRFNRFHTRWTGALDEQLLGSGYPLPLARLLFEIATAPPGQAPSARDLGQRLQLDTGYLSRLVGELEHDGLVVRTPSPAHGRRLELTLSDRGRSAFAHLDAASASHVRGQLDRLSAGDRRDLVAAMARVRRLLDDGRMAVTPPRDEVLLRDPCPGDMGHVVHRQARLYAQEYGWDWTFEALVADIAARFIREFQPGRERGWIAERDGDIVGSVFVVREDDETAKLRMLYVERSARGLGLGRRLVDECLTFARGAGYRRMVLWTHDCLVAARGIYEAAGLVLVEEQPHHSFGHDLVAQVWAREL